MEACTVAQIVVRFGTPVGIPGLQTVWRSAGIVLTTAWAGPRRAKRSRPRPVAAARKLNARLAPYGVLRMVYLGASMLWMPGRALVVRGPRAKPTDCCDGQSIRRMTRRRGSAVP